MAGWEGLWFPSIISKLCQWAGVPISSNEGLCLSKGALTITLILKIRHMDYPAKHHINILPHIADSPPHWVVLPPTLCSIMVIERGQTKIVTYLHRSLSSMDVVMRGMVGHLDFDLNMYLGLLYHPNFAQTRTKFWCYNSERCLLDYHWTDFVEEDLNPQGA